MPRRIFAVVSDEDFYAFRKRAEDECRGLTGKSESAMGKALAALAHGFAYYDEANTVKYLGVFAKVSPPSDQHLGDIEKNI